MNIHDPDFAIPNVTTGPLPASRKVYVKPDAAPDLRVPVREILLTEAAGEAAFPVYDTTGPYTDPNVTIDVEHGLSRERSAWVRARGGIEDYEGRGVTAEDNGNVSGKHAARRSWKEIRSVSEADGCIVILRRNGNAFVVPARAFGSTEERQRFFAFAQSCIRAEICEASLTV